MFCECMRGFPLLFIKIITRIGIPLQHKIRAFPHPCARHYHNNECFDFQLSSDRRCFPAWSPTETTSPPSRAPFTPGEKPLQKGFKNLLRRGTSGCTVPGHPKTRMCEGCPFGWLGWCLEPSILRADMKLLSFKCARHETWQALANDVRVEYNYFIDEKLEPEWQAEEFHPGVDEG